MCNNKWLWIRVPLRTQRKIQFTSSMCPLNQRIPRTTTSWSLPLLLSLSRRSAPIFSADLLKFLSWHECSVVLKFIFLLLTENCPLWIWYQKNHIFNCSKGKDQQKNSFFLGHCLIFIHKFTRARFLSVSLFRMHKELQLKTQLKCYGMK